MTAIPPDRTEGEAGHIDDHHAVNAVLTEHAADIATRALDADLVSGLAAKAAFSFPHIPSGFYVATGVLAPSTIAATQSRLYYTPIWLPPGTTIDRIGAEVTAGVAATTVSLGIYAPGANGLPSTLILDAGAINGSSATAQEINVSLTAAIAAGGLFYLASVSQGGAPTLRSIGATGPPSMPQHNQPAATYITSYYTPGVTGALPSPPASVSGSTVNAPRVFVRFA